MLLKMLKSFFLQFGKPEGVLGKIAGNLMTFTNKKQNQWTLSLLDIQTTDHVLEIGFGPGVATQMVSKLIQDGFYLGIDYSEVMLQQATKRNKQAIREGRVALNLVDVDHLPQMEHAFDKVFSVNSILFWKEPVRSLQTIRNIMKPNARIALTVLPYRRGATEEAVRTLGTEIRQYLLQAGFSDIRMEITKIKPAFAVCVLGVNPG